MNLQERIRGDPKTARRLARVLEEKQELDTNGYFWTVSAQPTAAGELLTEIINFLRKQARESEKTLKRNRPKYCGMGKLRISKVSDNLFICYKLAGDYWKELARYANRDDAVAFLDNYRLTGGDEL